MAYEDLLECQAVEEHFAIIDRSQLAPVSIDRQHIRRNISDHNIGTDFWQKGVQVVGHRKSLYLKADKEGMCVHSITLLEVFLTQELDL